MPRLKKLKIHGFKSFADRVALEFHPGITGIVGPNGCGKSNIADAFRWVLGETSAKSLRGKRMEDVIFAGTTSRKPSPFSEVSLTFEGAQEFLPTEYDELEITRRVTRNGESEFLINRQPVRMRDVINLFLDSGLGKHAFSIFEQGNIDEIIQKSPKERRSVFEEAAGILRFFERRKEAERKLELSETNISRVRDICKEIETQVLTLEQQAKEAESFQKKKAELEILERTLILLRFQGLAKEREKVRHSIVSKTSEIQSQESAIHAALEQISSAKALIEDKERSFHEMNEVLFQARSDKESTAREQESNKERMRESSSRLTTYEKQKEALEELQEKSAEELEKLDEKLKETKKREAEKKTALQTEKEGFLQMESELQESAESESKLKEEKLHLIREEKEIEGEIRETKARIESAHEKKRKSESEKTAKKKIREELSQKQVQQKELVSRLSLEVDEKKDILDGYEAEESALKEKGILLEKSVDELQREYLHLEARQRSLVRLKEEMEGATPAFKRLAKECISEKSPLYGKMRPLFEVVKPKGEHKSLLLLLLRPYSETFVVNDLAAFDQVLEYVKAEKLQDISLLSLDSLKDSQLESHFLKGAKSLKTHQEALKAIQGGASFVSLEEGGAVDAHLVYTKRKESEKNAFLRESEIEELKNTLKVVDQKHQEAIAALQVLKAQKGELWQRKLEADKDLKRCEMRQLESNFLLQKITADHDAAAKDEANRQSEEDQAKQELTKLEAALQKLQDLITQKQKALKELEARGQSIFARLEEARRQFEKKKLTLAKEQQESDELSFTTVRMDGEMKLLQAKVQDSGREMVRLQGEIVHLEQWKEKARAKSLTFEEAIARAETALAKALSDNKALESEILGQKKALAESESGLRAKMASIDSLKEQLTKLKVREAEVEAGLKAETDNFSQAFNCPIDPKAVLPADFNVPESSMRAKSLRRETLEMEGRINMMSIEELKKHKERGAYLKSQVDDMQLTKEEILQIISSLDKESRKLFEETFAKIRINFQKNFKVLFGEGGEADLEFVDSEDVLEAGIEIVAKPPGKKMRSINLLSGGEKCLTSMALLFSIFEIKPAPFCILDEIDAPLDDTNVERFLNVVKTFVDRCQFIIITHNKRTMAIADMLFGVSMEERGVSKLLSIEFKKEAVSYGSV